MITGINVYWRDSFINNMSFDYWEGDFLSNWTQDPGIGKIEQYNIPEGISVRLQCDEDESDKPEISQIISGLDSGETYTLNIRFKGNVLIKKDLLIIYSVNSDDWSVQPFTITGVESFILTLTMNDNDDYSEYAYFDYADLSVIDSLPLDITKIRSNADYERIVEDDLFEFVSDSFSLTVKNKPTTGYFNILDLINYPDRIYRFDVSFLYDNIVKKMIYFVGQDDNDVSRNRNSVTDLVSINLYELQTIFKQQKWYLGKLEQEEAAENEEETPDAVYKFRTGGDKELNSILSQMITNIESLLIQYQIPLSNIDLENITLSTATISGQLRVSNIIDYLIIPYAEYIPAEHSGRFFILSQKDDSIIQIWEIKNGIDCVLIHEIEKPLDSDSVLPFRFVHNYMSYPEPDEDDIYSGALYVHSLRCRTAGQFLTFYKFNFNEDNELVYSKEFDYFPSDEGEGFLPNEVYLKAFINENNDVRVPFDNESNINNFTYINDFPVLPSSDNDSDIALANEPDGNNYTFNSTIEDVDVHNGAYPDVIYPVAGLCDCQYYLYQFPHHFNLILDDIVFSELLREICLTQDSIWYFDYANGFKLKFSDKKAISGMTELTPVILEENSGKKLLRFNDLDSQIFANNKDRISLYIRYFNQRYGYGRKSYSLTCKKFENVNLADKNVYNNVNVVNLGYSYSENIGSPNSGAEKRTTINLFEVINV